MVNASQPPYYVEVRTVTVSATLSILALARRYIPKNNGKFIAALLGTGLVYGGIEQAYWGYYRGYTSTPHRVVLERRVDAAGFRGSGRVSEEGYKDI